MEFLTHGEAKRKSNRNHHVTEIGWKKHTHTQFTHIQQEKAQANERGMKIKINW